MNREVHSPDQQLRRWLMGGEIHVWRFALDLAPASVRRLRGWLSEDETARADRFLRQVDLDRFVTAHGVLRGILGCYLDADPRSLRFAAGRQGKPVLTHPSGQVCFNLAHSHALGLLAVGMAHPLGVDVEWIREVDRADQTLDAFFCPAEVRALQALPGEARRDAFFEAWTRKEAYLKARGDGLSMALQDFEVAVGPGRMAAILRVKGDPGEGERWSMLPLAPAAGYLGAVVFSPSCRWLRGFEWGEAATQAGLEARTERSRWREAGPLGPAQDETARWRPRSGAGETVSPG